MYSTVIWYFIDYTPDKVIVKYWLHFLFCMLCLIFLYCGLYLLILLTPLCSSSSLLPTGDDHQFVLHICESFLFCYIFKDKPWIRIALVIHEILWFEISGNIFLSLMFHILWRVDHMHAATCGEDTACGSSAAWAFRELPGQHQGLWETLNGNKYLQ